MKATNFWATSEGHIITDPKAAGFAETDCGPDMLTRSDSEYCERIASFRALFVAVDGSFKDLANSPEKLKAHIAARGCDTESGVSNDGIVRAAGVQYRCTGSKLWFDFSLVSMKMV